MELSQTETDNMSLGDTGEEVLTSIDETPAEAAVSVRVAVRVRPNPRPGKERGMLQVAPQSISTLPVTTTASGTFGLTGSPVLHPTTFHFDEVYHEGHGQAEVYAGSVEPLVTQFLHGYNATLLTYGQTASGKTHTMGTTESQMTEGMIGRSLEGIFNHLERNDAWILRVGYLEIYNEQLIDLLDDREKRVTIRQDPTGRIHLLDANMPRVKTIDDVFSILQQGNNRRSVASTLMNEDSSRSHAIFTLILEHDGIESKLHFVDLAGSERIKKTGAVGGRAKEGISINGGLLALSNVIGALGSNNTHIPYRESKLTRLLQDSLGGGAFTTLIACVSPAAGDVCETIDTLRYASRARKIKVHPARTVAAENLEETVATLREEIALLKTKPTPHIFVQTAIRKIIRRSREFELELMQLKMKHAELGRKYENLKNKRQYVTASTQTESERDPLSILQFASDYSGRESIHSRRSVSTRKTLNSLFEGYMPSPQNVTKNLATSANEPQIETKSQKEPSIVEAGPQPRRVAQELGEQVEAYQRRILYLKDKLNSQSKHPPFDLRQALQDISHLNSLVDHLTTVSSLYTSPSSTKQSLPYFTDESSRADDAASSPINITTTSFFHNMELSTSFASAQRSFPGKSPLPSSPTSPPLAPVCSPTMLYLSPKELHRRTHFSREIIQSNSGPPPLPTPKRVSRPPKTRQRKTFRGLICI